MAKDPAFLFYPGDWLGGTMGMTFEEKGAYFELLMLQFNRGHMSTHMIGQSVGHLWDKIKVKFRQDSDGLWYNERLELEKRSRQNFTKSRQNNLLGKNQYTKDKDKKIGHTTSRMENEDINENKDEVYFEKPEKLLAPSMIQIFKSAYPQFPDDLKTDSPHCLEIAQKIAKSKGWTMESITNGRLNDTLTAWKKIVEFSRTDDWFCTRAISDFNKEYQRLIQKMTNGNKVNRGNTSSSNTRITKSAGAEKLAGLLKDEIRNDIGGAQGS